MVDSVLETGYKRCFRCGERKLLSDFFRYKRNRDGRRSECKTCSSITDKRHYQKHGEAIRQKAREFNKTEHRRVYKREYERKRARERDASIETSTGRPKPSACEACGAVGPVHYEHDHRSGRFRGWLCIRCNCAIGNAKDDPSILRRLADYLDRQIARTS